MILFSLNSLGQLVGFLGPDMSAGSTGEIYRAGLSYGSEHLIKRATGKTTYEHVATLMYSE